MAEQKLDLFDLAPGRMAHASAQRREGQGRESVRDQGWKIDDLKLLER